VALGDYIANVEVDFGRALAAYEQGRKDAPRDPELLAAIAVAEQSVGRNADAVRDMQVAVSLDPRAPNSTRRLGLMLIWARRYPEARAALDRTIALAPTNVTGIQDRAMVEIADGNLAAARRIIAGSPPVIDRAALLVSMGNYWDMYWVLDDDDQARLQALPVSDYDGDRVSWAWVRSQLYALHGDSARAHAWADTARVASDEQLREAPNDAQRHTVRGLILASLGRVAEGVAESERGVALMPLKRDYFSGSYLQHQLARTYLAAGQPERALDILERLLAQPYYLSRGWLRIDPQFAPLRSNPRFQRLIDDRPRV
jgi:serine/threonine-protein kinase